eukprot:23975_1
MLKRAKEVGRESDCDASSEDAASVKKIGRSDAGKDIFQRKELIPNNIDKRLFAVDSSSQYGPPVTNLRTIALRNFQGKSGDNKFYREGGRAPLDYAVTGPAWELKANAADMYNVQELVYTDELKQNEAKDLLHVPKEDDLG